MYFRDNTAPDRFLRRLQMGGGMGMEFLHLLIRSTLLSLL